MKSLFTGSFKVETNWRPVSALFHFNINYCPVNNDVHLARWYIYNDGAGINDGLGVVCCEVTARLVSRRPNDPERRKWFNYIYSCHRKRFHVERRIFGKLPKSLSKYCNKNKIINYFRRTCSLQKQNPADCL